MLLIHFQKILEICKTKAARILEPEFCRPVDDTEEVTHNKKNHPLNFHGFCAIEGNIVSRRALFIQI